MQPQDTVNHRPIKILLHVIFLFSGISTVLIGQVLPILAQRFSLNDLEAGYFFPAQFSGSLLGTFFTSWFGRRQKFLTAAMIGCVLMAAGILMINTDSFAVCLSGFAINGLGIGLTLPTVNLLIMEMNPLRSASALSILNFCWGVGAILCKPFVDFFSNGTNIWYVTLLLAIPFLIAAAMIAFSAKGIEVGNVAENKNTETLDVAIWTTPLAWTLALFNFIHVGFESGIGGWLTTYADRLEGDSTIHILSPTFLYFLFFVVGRGVAPVFFRYLNENKVLMMNLLIILAGMGITLFAQNVTVLSMGAAVAGFGTSSVFPTSVSRFGRIFGPGSSRRAMPLFICGTLGAATVTWLIGFLSNRLGDLRSGMFTLVVGIALLILIQIGLGLRKKNTAAKI